MTATPEMLIGFMVVLVVLALSLVVFLLRGSRKGKQAKASPKLEASATSPAEDAFTEPASGDLTASGDITQETLAAPNLAPEPAVESTQPSRRTYALPDPATVPDPGAALLMQVWQDREGFLVIEIEGERYRRLFDIRDGVIGRRVMETINRLVAFSKGQETRVEPSATTVVASRSAEEAVAPESYLEQLRADEEAQRRLSRVSVDPVPFRRRSAAQQLGITLDLAGEIEKLLQVRLKSSPSYSQRYIHVAKAPDGGLRFDVDDAHYTALDQIPDPQVQELIRAAIADWEAKR